TARQAANDCLRQRYQFTSNAVLHWSKERQVELHYIAPGEPMQNAYIESFNGRMRAVSSFSRDGQVPSDTFIDNAILMAETTGRGKIMPAGVHAPSKSRSQE